MTDTDTNNAETTVTATETDTITTPVEPTITASPSQPADENPQKEQNLFDPNRLGILNDVSILLTIEVGRAQVKIRDLLNFTKGSVIELNKLAGDPVDIYANGKLISIGNIITANGKYCVRLTSIPDKAGANTDGK